MKYKDSRDWSWKQKEPAKPEKKWKREKKKNKRQRRAEKRQKIAAAQTQEGNFYKSWEWKKLRFEILKFYGRRCMCCGAAPEDGKVIVVDHIKPVKKFWALRLDFNNCQVLCNDCNMGKSGDDETDFREPLPDGAYDHLKAIVRH